jgi:hypothetical protein
VVFVVDHLTELAEIYDSVLTLTARRTDAAPGTPPADPAPQAIPVPTPADPGVMVDPVVISAFTFLDQKRFVFAESQDHPGGCRTRRPGAAANVGVSLEPSAAYRVTLTVDRVGGALGLGHGPVIAESMFATSRYADAPSMFLELGFATGGAATGPVPFPLPDSATMPAADSTFEVVLSALQLDGYRTGARGGSAALWKRQGQQWLFAGVLVECPEPIERPDRVHVLGVLVGDLEVSPIWDARRTRLIALVAPEARDTNVIVRFDVIHTRPGDASVREQFATTVSPFRPDGGPP